MNVSVLTEKYRAILPIIGVCISYGLSCIYDGAIKIIASGMHVSQLMFLYFLFQIVAVVFVGWKVEGKNIFKTKYPKFMFVRSIIAQLNIAAGILAVANLDLATYYTLSFTGPFWVAIMASFFLKDKVGINRLAVVLIGFSAVVYALDPSFNLKGFVNIWALMILFRAFICALDIIFIRKRKETESTYFLMLSVAVVGIIVHFPIMLNNYIPVTGFMCIYICVLAFVKMMAFLIKVYCFQVVDSAAVVAPLNYTQMVWGAIIGYVLFNEIPSQHTVIAASIIVMSGIYLMYTENNSKYKEA